MAVDLLAPQAGIVERLIDQVSGFRAVLTAADLAGIKQSQQVTPAAHVVYAGFEVPAGQGQQDAEGGSQVILVRWMVVVAVRNARTQVTGAAAREDAGPLMGAVIEALKGWAPAEGFAPLVMRPAPPAAYDAGFADFPILFTTTTVV